MGLEWRLAGVSIPAPLVLAPMAGITDGVFRSMLRRAGGVGLVTMEFLAAARLVRREPATLQRLHFDPAERPIAVQVYGSDPATMAEAAAMVEAMGADLCDINMGCPANKILKGCAGCALMGDLPLARAIVRAVRRRISIPLTVKFRTGLREDEPRHLHVGRICQDEGADAVTLHPRTARAGYGGSADWTRIRELKETLTIPVVGNGDVTEAAQARRMLDETGCDAVMIGRGALRNPWIFNEARDILCERSPEAPTAAQRRAWILEHFRRLRDERDPAAALHKLRTFTGWYSRGIPEGAALRRRIGDLRTPEAFRDAVERHFEGLERRVA